MDKLPIKRIDPINCGCTDCITRSFSVPLNDAKVKHIRRLLAGKLMNATSYDLSDITLNTDDGVFPTIDVAGHMYYCR
jgi:hypothetical protein